MAVELVNDGPVTVLLEVGSHLRRLSGPRPRRRSQRVRPATAQHAGAPGAAPASRPGARTASCRRRPTSRTHTACSLMPVRSSTSPPGVDEGAEAGRRTCATQRSVSSARSRDDADLLRLQDRARVAGAVRRVEQELPAVPTASRARSPKNTSQEIITPSRPTGLSSTGGPVPGLGVAGHEVGGRAEGVRGGRAAACTRRRAPGGSCRSGIARVPSGSTTTWALRKWSAPASSVTPDSDGCAEAGGLRRPPPHARGCRRRTARR